MASGKYIALTVTTTDTAQPLTAYVGFRLTNAIIQVKTAGAGSSHGVYFGEAGLVTSAVQGTYDPCNSMLDGFINLDMPSGLTFDPSTFWVKSQTSGETYYVTVSGVSV